MAQGTAPVSMKARATRKSAARRETGAALGFLSPIIIGLGLFTVFPIAFSLVMSLFDWPVFGERTFVGVDNFTALFADGSFWVVMRNTLLIVLVYVPVNIVVTLGLAIWISQLRWGKNLYRTLFFIPAVTPIVANAIIWQLMFQPRGLVARIWEQVTGLDAANFLGDRGWAMTIVILLILWQGIGYNTLIFSAAIDTLPTSVIEASRIDGAGFFRRHISIVLPLMTPSIFFAIVMTLISSFQIFAEPFILTQGGPGDATETLVTFLFRTGFRQYDLGMASAIAWIIFALIMVVTAVQFLLQRKWVHYDD